MALSSLKNNDSKRRIWGVLYGLLSVKKDAEPHNDLIFSACVNVIILSSKLRCWYFPLHFAFSSMSPLKIVSVDFRIWFSSFACGIWLLLREKCYGACCSITGTTWQNNNSYSNTDSIHGGVPPTWWWLPRSSHLWQMVTFTSAGNVAGQPNVKECLQGRLCCLTLGQLLAASWAFKCSPIHSHRHHKTLAVLLLHSLRQADVPQARPQLI